MTDSTFVFNPDNLYRSYLIDVFNTRIGNELNFHGSKICTTSSITEGTVIPEINKIDWHGRITCKNDTSFILNDSAYGTALINSLDITGWKTLFLNLFDSLPKNIIGKIFVENLDSTLIAIFDTLSYTTIFDTSNGNLSIKKNITVLLCKNLILNTFNKLVNQLDFYYRYRQQIVSSWIKMEPIYEHVNWLTKCSVFLDSLGTVNINASTISFNSERIKWLNHHLLTRYLNIALLSNYPDKFIFNNYSITPRIFTFDFQQGAQPDQLNKRNVSRLMALSINGTNQIGYNNKYGFTKTEQSTLFEFPIKTDVDWSVTPFYWLDINLIPHNKISDLILPSSAFLSIVRVQKDNAGTITNTLFGSKMHYPLQGSYIENNKIIRVFGTIVVNLEFYCRTDSTRSIFTQWNTDIAVERIEENGDKTRYIEKVELKSDSCEVI